MRKAETGCNTRTTIVDRIFFPFHLFRNSTSGAAFLVAGRRFDVRFPISLMGRDADGWMDGRMERWGYYMLFVNPPIIIRTVQQESPNCLK